MSYFFTIFTPCYNGGKYIHRVFESVSMQTYTNFEWIIINDGSTDDSSLIIKKLIAQYKNIEKQIIYIEQPNQGKHKAWNKALSIAKGDLFISADCDDSFTANTLSFFNEKASEIKDFLHSAISGINVCCYDPQNHSIIGSPYPQNGLVSDNIELSYLYQLQGEHWGTVRIDLLKKYTFPNIKGNFYNEAYIWYSLAKDKYKTICYNEALRAYYYVPTSLVNNKKAKLDLNRIKMELHFSLWEMKNISHLIYKYSLKSALHLYSDFIKGIIKYCIAYILTLFIPKKKT